MWDFHALFARHAAELHRFLQRQGHSADSAAELTQETFLRTIKSPPTWSETQGNARAYLFRVSRNLSSNQKRRDRVIAFVALEDIGESASQLPSAEAVVQGKQMVAQTRRALAALPERTRRAFILYRLGGYTIAEVAQDLGLSTTRTWALIHEAYRHLLDQVGDL